MTARDPVRLADLGSDQELAGAIRALRKAPDSSAQVALLAQRLAPQLAQNAVAGTAGWALGSVGKAAIAGALSLVIGLGVVLYVRQDAARTLISPSAVPAAQSSSAPLPVPSAAPAPVGSDAAAHAAASDAAAEAVDRGSQPRAVRNERGARSRAGAGSGAMPVVAPEQELALLERSRAALDRDPAAALARAEEHARAYPHGVFAQEREVLAIEALLKLHRRPRAVARAQDFMRRYPESSHARRVRALLERSRSMPATMIDGSGDSTPGTDG